MLRLQVILFYPEGFLYLLRPHQPQGNIQKEADRQVGGQVRLEEVEALCPKGVHGINGLVDVGLQAAQNQQQQSGNHRQQKTDSVETKGERRRPFLL